MRALIDTRWAVQLSGFVARDALRRLFTAPRRSAATALALAAMAGPAFGQGLAAAPGPNEIRIGNTAPYTGPASAYGVIAKAITAYLDKTNAEGGINGRKVNMITYDDAYEPTKTMAMTRKLVEEDNVLLALGTIGTNTNAAIQPYLNSKKVPHLFALSGAAAWDQPQEFPWTIGFLPTYTAEAQIFAQYLLENHPRSKIAVLYQEDGMGKEYLKGLKDGLGGKMAIVAEAPYKVTDTTIDAQMAKLKASGADVLIEFTTPKFAIMAIKRTAELGWRPLQFAASISNSYSAVIQPAGPQNAEGLLSAAYRLEGEDAAAAGEAVFREWSAFMQRYVPSVSKTNGQAVLGYLVGKLTVEVLKNCGDDLSRENIMRQARLLKGIQLPMMVQGIQINTSPSDHAPIEQMRMMRFTNGQWQHFGPVRSGVDAGAVSDSFKTIFKYGTATKRDLANQLNANTVSLMTGSFGSTYAQVGADLASVLDNGTNLRILPVMGRGSVQAVADILLLRGVDAGIVRKDTLVLSRPQGLRQGHPQPVRLRRQDVQRGNARPGAEDDHQHEGPRRQDRGGRFARQLDLRDGDQRVRPARHPAASDLSGAAAGGGHAAQGRGRRDRGDRRQAAAMAEPDQRPQSASGAGRIRQAAAGGVSALQAWLGGLPEPGGGGWLRRDDRGRGRAGVV